ncbi:synaptotagmin-4 [Chanos chanos]|uniref:Synaptotagmin-4 n=1 Tax=Chanos chanos TaxID=29144 RepID=A0A6J2WYJ6_CHACN|nr:synaptotagmin-4-like [Chanos chanos]
MDPCGSATRQSSETGQPLWQAVLFLFCKGMIEGVLVLLFIGLLVQVLITKHLEVHLQILLAVGLAIFCFCLVLGCIICWRRQKFDPFRDKELGLSPSSVPVDHVTMALSPSPSIDTLSIKQQYEELEGDVLDYPSLNSSSTPSEDDLTALPLPPHPCPLSELNEPRRSCFPLRRLSSPALPSMSSKPVVHGRTSMPSIPKLGLVAKTRRALDRRRSVSGESSVSSERSRLTLHSSPSLQGAPSSPHYGSSSSSSSSSRRSSVSGKPASSLQFTLLFSPSAGRLTVTVLGVFRKTPRRGGVTVHVSLPPVCPALVQGRRRSLNPEQQTQSFSMQVGTVEQLRTCTLRLAVFGRDFSGLRETAVGDLELSCAEVDWEPDKNIAFDRELNPVQRKLKKSLSSQEALGGCGDVVPAPRALGQIFILLQYQTLAHRIKVMVRKAEGLAKLTRMPGAPDHSVVINLCHEGKMISTKETRGAAGSNAVWNTPFLFDLPRGDITQLPLVLEFIIMQGHLYTKSSTLGRVLIGHEGPETGQSHWREMCSRGQVEIARWHAVRGDTL